MKVVEVVEGAMLLVAAQGAAFDKKEHEPRHSRIYLRDLS